ncbi:DUF2332 domain-containing protein [Roseateles saccharophilus]|uniref:DUF2332 domain-containing protein n=1 Tax=Roseateles saccharophilus TaxID=304 RepID=A0A4R3VJ95_ROSSA|nr:DUF2332 domain-containing protein [Roseateles saccharophilus]MDG0831341.1 DUF2332 domain-containing protein [Roseateles saccharophilus]TCV04471.1 hypothetical protein EV671_1001227 [Roseateles saccharophilus]
MDHPEELAELLRRFGREECAQEPLYAALCELAAEDARLCALLAEAPPEQRKVNLLLAALHERVLAGAATELAAYYPSAGGGRAVDSGLAAALAACVEREWPALVQHLRHGATQTNEVARGAAIWPALGAAAAATGARHLALLDFGCSAGLNLGVDRYALRYRGDDGGWHARGAARDGRAAEIESLWLGGAPLPPLDAGWRLALRHGLDPAPVDVNDPARLRWLQACLWPHDARRRERLARAAAQLQALPHRLARADDCVAAIEPWLLGLPAGVQPVLLTSWVLYYLSPADLARLRVTVDRLALGHGLAWICGELPALSARCGAAPPLPAMPAGEVAASATLWTLRHARAGRIAERHLGWSHPHGRWVAWL